MNGEKVLHMFKLHIFMYFICEECCCHAKSLYLTEFTTMKIGIFTVKYFYFSFIQHEVDP